MWVWVDAAGKGTACETGSDVLAARLYLEASSSDVKGSQVESTPTT